MLAVVVSRADSASEHVGDHLLDLVEWEEAVDDDRPDGEGGGTVYRREGVELRTFDAIHLDLEGVADAFDDPDLLAFASRHAGETGPLLTAHHTGNFGPAEFGGADGALARACPNAHRAVFEALDEHAPESYEVGMEATHHGPSDVGVPSMFVEVGSDEPQWEDPAAARAVARAILDLADVSPDAPRENGARRHLVGFGGGHYAPRFERVLRETDWAVGHVGADWALAEMGSPDANRAVIEGAFERSRADRAVIEGDRPGLVDTIEDLGHRVVSETWVREVGDRPLALVDHLEGAIGPVDGGLRFGSVISSVGEAGRGDPADGVTLRDLPGELLARAQGVDAEAARTAVESNAVAFDTEQSGTRAAGAVAFAADDAAPGYADLVADLATVLAAGYDEVVVDDDAVIARETAFDPGLAAELGVPEGPAFGRLASGEPVEVDGETIGPETVSTRREERFPVE